MASIQEARRRVNELQNELDMYMFGDYPIQEGVDYNEVKAGLRQDLEAANAVLHSLENNTAATSTAASGSSSASFGKVRLLSLRVFSQKYKKRHPNASARDISDKYKKALYVLQM
jgi:hypothetical protein